MNSNGIRLHHVLPILRRRWFILAAALAVGLLLAVIAARRPHQYTAQSAVVLVDANVSQSKSSVDNPSVSIQTADLPTLAQSSTILQRVAKDLGYHDNSNLLRARLKARVALLSSVMPIRFSDSDPARAVAGANAVADELAKYYSEINTARYDRLNVDLNQQLRARRRQLALLDAEIAVAASDNPLLDAKNGIATITSDYAETTTKLHALEAATAGDVAASQIFSQLLTDLKPLAMHEISEADPVYRNVRDQYAKDAAALQKIRASYTAKYPGLPELKAIERTEASQLDAAKTRVAGMSPALSKSYSLILDEKAAADAKVQSDRAQTDTLRAQLRADRVALSSSGGKNVSLANLRRERDAAETSFQALATRVTAAAGDRAQAATIGSIAVIDRAVSAEAGPLSSFKVLLAAMSVIALFVGCGIAFAAEAADTRLNAGERIEKLYGLPVFDKVGA